MVRWKSRPINPIPVERMALSSDNPGVLCSLLPGVAGAELSGSQIERAVAALIDPRESDVSKATFLRALRDKGETPAEIAGFAAALLARAVDPEIDPARLPGPMLDVCGTGGDRLHLFNVSTTASFILAAGGAVVVKHGNRAITSKSGGSDVLAALGIPLDLVPADLRVQLETVGIGFMSAPQYHPAFAAVAGVRRQLAAEGTSTIFNLLGPLLNPARPAHQVVGVFSPGLTPVFADVLRQLGRRRAWAVHGAGGMDELSTLGATQVSLCERATGKRADTFSVEPEAAGLPRVAGLDRLRGGAPDQNAGTLVGIVCGEITDARLDLVLLNGAPVSEAQLRNGDRVRFGSIEAAYYSDNANVVAPLPVAAEPVAQPAAESRRPTNFENSSPFQKKNREIDPAGKYIMYCAIAAVVLFIIALVSIFMLHR